MYSIVFQHVLILFAVSFACVLTFPSLQLNPQKLPFFEHGLKGVRDVATKSRLPTNVIPLHYELALVPIIDPERVDFLTAYGRVEITVTCLEPTNTITLHSAEIDIDQQLLRVTHATTNTDLSITDILEDEINETLTIQLGTLLVANEEYTIEIIFLTRVADDRLNGLYLSQYTDPETGTTNYHVATQFQAIAARKAFPCFDEPALKATFKIRVGRHENFATLSNMQATGELAPIGELPGYSYDIYPTTSVRMSTYLVAIVVSDFASEIADPTLYPSPVSVWGPTPLMESSDHGVFAAETAAKTLSFFDEYLNHPYDFPKLDSFAVSEFAYGAMENWGLNTYRPDNLLFTASESTHYDKWRIASVIAHEISHQWFGNLVTMKWWDDLWLNEGIANYILFEAVEAVNPQFQPWQRFGIDSSQGALEFDGTPNAIPVHGDNVTHFEDPPSGWTYEKASAIIKMMEGFLSKETLIGGFQNYLQGLKAETAEQDDLFRYLNEQAIVDETLLPKTVKEIMDTWTLNPGFPLVSISRVGNTRIFISQERFSNDANYNLESHTWHVPITYTTKANPIVTDDTFKPKTWLDENELLISHPVDTTAEWILLNPDAKSFYRVLYDTHLTNLLKEQFDEDHLLITPLSRGQLLDDYFKCAFAEYTSIKTALEFTTFLNKEDELPVWVSVFNNLKKIWLLVGDNAELGEEFRTYLLSKVGPAFERIGPTPTVDDTTVDILLREQLMDWACTLGHPLCFSTATELLSDWMSDESQTNPFLPDYQPMMYCAAVSSGGELHLDFLIEKYAAENVSPRQQSLLLNAMACPSESTLLTSAMDMAVLDDSVVRFEDAVTLMRHVAENSDGRDLAFTYIKTNVGIILESRVDERGISTVISTLSNYFSTTERLQEVQQFLEDNTMAFSPTLIASIQTSLEAIEANIRWMSIHELGVREFLDTVK